MNFFFLIGVKVIIILTLAEAVRKTIFTVTVTATGLLPQGRGTSSEFSGDSCRPTAEGRRKGVGGWKITKARHRGERRSGRRQVKDSDVRGRGRATC